MNVPAAPYVCDTLSLEACPPSPKLHWKLKPSPSGSVEAEPSKLTVNGASPDVGCALAAACGGWFGGGGGAPGPFTTMSSKRVPELTLGRFPLFRTMVALSPAASKEPTLAAGALWSMSPDQPPGLAQVSFL